jgi:hypothetical protein
LKEYKNLVECDKNIPNIDPSKMNKDYIREIELRHEANKQKRLEKGLKASVKDFVTNG